MQIVKTDYPILIYGVSDADTPTSNIMRHIVANIEMYDGIDGTLIDLSMCRLMQKYGGSSHNPIVQRIIGLAIDGVKSPIFLANFDKHDEFYDFGPNSVVFSPESSYSMDNFIGIPRTTVVTDTDTHIEKTELFSFKGANWTHPIRQRLINTLPNECSGYRGWGVDNNDSGFRDNYINLIKKSKFSLCPRGYGRTSFRLYESMMVGTVPVIISDDWKPPLSFMFNWNDFSVTIKEAEIDKIPEILKSFSDEDIIRMGAKAKDVFSEYLSGENMWKCFYLYFKGDR